LPLIYVILAWGGGELFGKTPFSYTVTVEKSRMESFGYSLCQSRQLLPLVPEKFYHPSRSAFTTNLGAIILPGAKRR